MSYIDDLMSRVERHCLMLEAKSTPLAVGWGWMWNRRLTRKEIEML